MKKIISFIIALIIITSTISYSAQQIVLASSDEPKTTSEEPTDNKETPKDEKEKIIFNKPVEMRAVNVLAGVDFYTKDNMTQKDVMAEIDGVINTLKKLTFNTIILDLNLKDKVIYSSELTNSVAFSDEYFDMLDYFIKKVKENKMFIYTTFDVDVVIDGDKNLKKSEGIDEESINLALQRLEEFVNKYKVDGIVIDNYYNVSSKDMYLKYRSENSGNTFENWLRNWSQSAFSNIILKIKDIAPNVQVGAYLDEVWVQSSVDPSGTPSNFTFSALNNGFSDTKKIVENTDLNFAILKTSSTTTNPNSKFSNVANWWSKLISEKQIPFYIQYTNSLINSEQIGWKKHDEIVRQAIYSRDIAGFSGGSYDSLTVLKEDRFKSTTALIKYYKNEIDPNLILKDFVITNFKEKSVKTYEVEVGFVGAVDPTFDLSLNDSKVEVQPNGAFSITKPLKIGANTFVFKHKGEEYKYDVFRSVNIFNDVTPKGTVRVEGSSTLELVATAYKGAKVSATVNGRRILLKEGKVNDDETENNSYTKYIGTYKMPPSGAIDKNIGIIKFTGTYEGITQSKSGGSVIINKKFIPPTPPNNDTTPPNNDTTPPNNDTTPPNNDTTPPNNTPSPAPSDGYRAVVVRAGDADGYDPNVNTRYPAINVHRLPAGTIDFIASNRILYNGVGYYILKSGIRVRESHIQMIDNPKHGFNRINGITFSNAGSRLNMVVDYNYKSSFKVKYNNVNYDLVNNGINGQFAMTSLDIEFDNINFETGFNMGSNNLFSGASYRQAGDKKIMTLHLKKAGAFYGFTTYFNSNGDLVLSFNNINNPGGNSLNGVRVYVDPGHGGRDGGAGPPGAVQGQTIYEKDVTRAISQKLVNVLKAKGATVQMTDNRQYVSLDSRIQQSKNFNANLFVSVHCNAAIPSAHGTESYWYNPMSKRMSDLMLNNVANATGLRARRSEFANYVVTRHQYFPAVLYETAFLTNSSELSQLINPNFQQTIANALANAIVQFSNTI